MYSGMTVVAVFALVQPMMYINYAGGESSAIAMRLAAIGATFMLQPCSDEQTTYRTYADEYHGLIDEVTGVFVMLLVDLFLGDRPASEQVKRLLTEAMETYQAVFERFVEHGCKGQSEIFGEVAAIQAKIDAATALAADAANEPLLWRDP